MNPQEMIQLFRERDGIRLQYHEQHIEHTSGTMYTLFII